MALPLKFLIVDDNADSRFLLVKTLLRKFPDAVLLECHSSDSALKIARQDQPAAIVAHRADDSAGPALVAQLRQANATVPIVMVSGFDRAKEAAAAGANAFLNYDEWLRIGTIVRDLLSSQGRSSPPFSASTETEPAAGR